MCVLETAHLFHFIIKRAGEEDLPVTDYCKTHSRAQTFCLSWKHTVLMDCTRGWQIGWARSMLNTKTEGKELACSAGGVRLSTVLSVYGSSYCGVSQGWSGMRFWLSAQN